jgi:hypothetical protein
MPVPYGRPYCQGNGSPQWTVKESATVADRWWFPGCIVSPSANEAIRSRPPLANLKMQESKLLGFWPIRHDGRIAESPNWLGPILPGEPQQEYQPRSRNVRPILPGEPQPMRYRRTASGYRIAWDEPGENF